MKLKNVILVIKDQMPLKRFFINFFITRNAWGLFSKHSHIRKDGVTKNIFPTKRSAQKAADQFGKKKGMYFSNYKCLWCDGYHIGKNRTSQNKSLK